MIKPLIRALALAAVLLAAALPTAPASAQAPWRLAQPAAPEPPVGVPPAPYALPLGAIGDIQFWAPNRGLMLVQGNGKLGANGQDGVVKEGLYRYDGKQWTPFSNVCGGDASYTRIAWAGPREFWTVAATRTENRNQYQGFDTLCHFRDGSIVASYATPRSDPDAYLQMNSATCLAPDDCWFGGVALEEPEAGAFHLHWDGNKLETVIGPQGRPVLDMEAFDGRTFEALTHSEAAFVAPRLTDTSELWNQGTGKPRGRPLLLHSIAGRTTQIVNDPFVSAFAALATTATRVASDEFKALDADQDHLWAAGGHATTGPNTEATGRFRRGPLLAIRDAAAAGGASSLAFRELVLDPAIFTKDVTIADVAANPGTHTAWLALGDPAFAGPIVAKVDSSGAVLEYLRLPLEGDTDPNASAQTTGAASKISCSAADECWLATAKGWLYHLASGAILEPDDDPYFQTYLPTRPPDATSVLDLSDVVTPDDSGADLPFSDGTIELVEQVEDPVVPEPKPAPRATNVRVRAVSRRTVEVSFRLSTRANVELRLLRGKKTVVAKYKRRVLARGPHKLRFRVSVKRWPNNIKLDVTNA